MSSFSFSSSSSSSSMFVRVQKHQVTAIAA